MCVCMRTVDICISVYVLMYVCMYTVDMCVHWCGQRHSFLSHFLPSVVALHALFVFYLKVGGKSFTN